MTRLPLSVIGGYLGAGKTTLINRLLSLDHGLRLAVLVNDFGSINIDAALLKSASKDTIELTNGCVCCTMTSDLFFALGDMLDRHPRPDHLIVEASGIADPARIANVALAEPDLRYAGILTVVDAENFPYQMADDRIAGQLRAQVECADFVAMSKSTAPKHATADLLRKAGTTRWVSADAPEEVAGLLFDPAFSQDAPRPSPDTHPGYAKWALPSSTAMDRAKIEDRLARLPSGLLRVKGLIPDGSGNVWEVHVVGRKQEIIARTNAEPTGLVAIGLADDLTPDDIRDWWMSGS